MAVLVEVADINEFVVYSLFCQVHVLYLLAQLVLLVQNTLVILPRPPMVVMENTRHSIRIPVEPQVAKVVNVFRRTPRQTQH
jgi:hypothetical protein